MKVKRSSSENKCSRPLGEPAISDDSKCKEHEFIAGRSETLPFFLLLRPFW